MFGNKRRDQEIERLRALLIDRCDEFRSQIAGLKAELHRVTDLKDVLKRQLSDQIKEVQGLEEKVREHERSQEQEKSYWAKRYNEEPAEDVDRDYQWSQTPVASDPYHRGKSFQELSTHYYAQCARINQESDGEAWTDVSNARDKGFRFKVLHDIQERYQQGNAKDAEKLVRDHHIPVEDAEEAKRRGVELAQQETQKEHKRQQGQGLCTGF